MEIVTGIAQYIYQNNLIAQFLCILLVIVGIGLNLALLLGFSWFYTIFLGRYHCTAAYIHALEDDVQLLAAAKYALEHNQ
jgi:hypothetical protein